MFLQKQNLATAIYLFGLGTLLNLPKSYKGYSPEPPTIVVKWMETLGVPVFPAWFLSFGNRTQNSRLVPNHQPIGGENPNHQGIWSPPRGAGTSGPREEPGTLTQGGALFSLVPLVVCCRLGIEPKTPGWLVQSPTTSPSGDLICMRGTLLLNQVGQPDGVEDDGFFVRLRVQPLEIALICHFSCQ